MTETYNTLYERWAHGYPDKNDPTKPRYCMSHIKHFDGILIRNTYSNTFFLCISKTEENEMSFAFSPLEIGQYIILVRTVVFSW